MRFFRRWLAVHLRFVETFLSAGPVPIDSTSQGFKDVAALVLL
jgi:hypothetical protein